ncbi:carboxypeptidase-like regulatory domain-containing protein [Cellulophaga sp. L1A9]|uniref:carboxypeptidase-like regulatory domain-containing protein n=1 Tax=Cellulophaga sp. L1A9 TaxID=2686362 RepID=UPI001E526EC4|nr:carboxypeptidase-like regulatory domain-containing protein [Cellulophaga sp. L1A9]
MKKMYLLLLLAFGVISMTNAQISVKGNVVSSLDGMPAPGVSVTVKDQKISGTATDFDGNF